MKLSWPIVSVFDQIRQVPWRNVLKGSYRVSWRMSLDFLAKYRRVINPHVVKHGVDTFGHICECMKIHNVDYICVEAWHC